MSLDDQQLLHAFQHVFLLLQKARDDAGDMAAGLQHGMGDGAHQAEIAAAIDQPDAVFRENFAQEPRGSR